MYVQLMMRLFFVGSPVYSSGRARTICLTIYSQVFTYFNTDCYQTQDILRGKRKPILPDAFSVIQRASTGSNKICKMATQYLLVNRTNDSTRERGK